MRDKIRLETLTKVLEKLDRLELAIVDVLDFGFYEELECNTSIAVGPNKGARPENTANVVAFENAKRAVVAARQLWKEYGSVRKTTT